MFRNYSWQRFGVMAIALFVLAGCSSSPTMVSRNHFVEFTSDQVLEIESYETREYKLQEGDVLLVAFSFMKELDQEHVVVLPDGAVSLIGVDRVEVAGLTISEADDRITNAYSVDYRDPKLSIIVRTTQGRKVYVLGEVNHPGLHSLPTGGLDLVGAIAVAGGFTDDAAKEGAVLVRTTAEGYLCREVDLSGFHTVQYMQLATEKMQSFDVLYVPRSRIGDFAYFNRSVLTGILSLTRIAADAAYLSGSTLGRY